MTIADQPDLSEVRGHVFLSPPAQRGCRVHQKLEKYIHGILN